MMEAKCPKGEEWVLGTALEAVTPPARSLGGWACRRGDILF